MYGIGIKLPHMLHTVETVDDPVTPVEAILKRCNKAQMQHHYGIGDYSNSTQFLAHLARRQGRMKKGGVPDVQLAARTVLQDWNTGKISYYTQPPEDRSRASQLSAEVVKQYSAEFDIGALIQRQKKELNELVTISDDQVVMSSSVADAQDEEELIDESSEEAAAIPKSEPVADSKVIAAEVPESVDSDSDMEEEKDTSDLASTIVDMPEKKCLIINRTSQPSGSSTKDEKKSRLERQLAGNRQSNRSKKAEYKKMLKKRKKSDKLAGTLSSALDLAMDSFTFGTCADADGDEKMAA